MKTLYLLRHAKSSWDFEDIDDHDRPLSDRGKKDSLKMGRFLKKNNYIPDFILCSTARRTKDTINLILNELETTINIKYDGFIYDGEIDDILELIKQIKNDYNKVLLVGHNPMIEELLEYLTKEEFPYEKYSTCGFSIIDFDVENWNDVINCKGNLKLFITPKKI